MPGAAVLRQIRAELDAAISSEPSALIRWSVYFYLLHLLLQPKIALSELMAFGSIFTLGWALARREVRFSFHILYFPLVVYGLVSTIAAIAAETRVHAAFEGMLWYKMLIFPAAIVLYRRFPRLQDFVLYAYAILAGGSSIWGLIQFTFLDQRDLEHRINGPVSHVMTFSGTLLPLALMFLLLWWHQRKPLFLAVTILSTLALLLTFTRSVWLGWTVAALVLLMSTRSQVRYFALPALLIFLTFLPMPLFSRLVSTFDTRQESNFDRIRMLEAGVEIIRDHPVLGVGPANVKELYAIYKKHDAPRPRPPHLHNNVIQLWAERGILGLAAYVTLLALFLRECARAWRGPKRMWAEIGLGVTVSLTVAGLFEFNFGDTEVFYLMLNLFALIVVAIERPQPGSNEALNEPGPTVVPAP